MPSFELRWKGLHLQQRRYTHFSLFKSAACNQVVGFDMVDDESKPERRPAKHMKTPREWELKHNPAYAYYAFYTYANLYTLNKLREARGLNTFALRPHAGAQDFLSQSFLDFSDFARKLSEIHALCFWAFAVFSLPLCMLCCPSSMLSLC